MHYNKTLGENGNTTKALKIVSAQPQHLDDRRPSAQERGQKRYRQ